MTQVPIEDLIALFKKAAKAGIRDDQDPDGMADIRRFLEKMIEASQPEPPGGGSSGGS